MSTVVSWLLTLAKHTSLNLSCQGLLETSRGFFSKQSVALHFYEDAHIFKWNIFAYFVLGCPCCLNKWWTWMVKSERNVVTKETATMCVPLRHVRQNKSRARWFPFPQPWDVVLTIPIDRHIDIWLYLLYMFSLTWRIRGISPSVPEFQL